MFRIFLSLTLALLAAGAAPAQDDPWEVAAKKLQAATVTVRIANAVPKSDATPDPLAKPADKASEGVVVCTGVCVQPGRIITAAMAGSDSRIRLTLPGGAQSDAKLQLIDEFSGLALLKTDARTDAVLEMADKTPAVGGGVMTAAAWGVEQPLVSQGIVAGVERQRPGASYPPLLQCDLRTMDTSSGAGIVDRLGKLVGIIVATDSPETRRGWAYAVPTAHVQRMLRAADEQKGDGVLILKRRRPVVGWILDQDEEAIVVRRLTAGGPAEKAGVKVGDIILATEGVEIRSVYQAVLPTLSKQPGDTITFRIERPDGLQDIKVTLGGGVEVSSAPFELLAGLIQPKVEIVRQPDGTYIAKRGERTVREVFSPPLPDEEPPVVRTSQDTIALLEKALDRYRIVIELQQKQLVAEQKRRHEQEELLQGLRTEMEALRRQLDAVKAK